jgi:HEPN domain-containing protein
MNRSREQVIWEFVQEWLGKAEGDLRAAEHLLTLAQRDYFTAAFHAQQAAEKFLKAFLVRHQIAFPKTHDLQELIELAARADTGLRAELASAVMLTPFGIEFRYPGEQIADLLTARDALKQAQQVREIIRQRLQTYLVQGRPANPADTS